METYFTIPLAFAVAIWGIFGLPQTTTPILSAVTLAALGIVLGSILQNRKSNQEVKDLVAALTESQVREIKASDYLRDRNDFESFPESIASAKKIFFMGPTLVNIFSQWHSFLYHEKLNKQGALIQAVFLDPDSHSIESAALYAQEFPEDFKRDIERSFSYINLMLSQGLQNGSIEARTNSIYPNISMVLIDPEEPYGRISVEFKGYGNPLHSQPHIELIRKRDGAWFEYFFDQYKFMWRDSQPKYNSKSQDLPAQES